LNIYFTQFYIGPDSSHVDEKVCKKLNMVFESSKCEGKLIYWAWNHVHVQKCLLKYKTKPQKEKKMKLT
jgi:hypothetical protein